MRPLPRLRSRPYGCHFPSNVGGSAGTGTADKSLCAGSRVDLIVSNGAKLVDACGRGKFPARRQTRRRTCRDARKAQGHEGCCPSREREGYALNPLVSATQLPISSDRLVSLGLTERQIIEKLQTINDLMTRAFIFLSIELTLSIRMGPRDKSRDRLISRGETSGLQRLAASKSLSQLLVE